MKNIILFLLLLVTLVSCKEDEIPNNLPILTTNPISEMYPRGCISGGNITSDGGEIITVRGVCWDTSSSPTTNSDYEIDRDGDSNNVGVGNFQIRLFDLTSNTTYYVRAFATNANGTAYGNELIIRTPKLLHLRSQQEVNDFVASNHENLIIEELTIGDENATTNITDISGLNFIEKIKRGLHIYNTQLTNLDGLSHLAYSTGIDIIDNEHLINIDGLNNLEAEDGIGVRIINNKSLLNIDGLQNLAPDSLKNLEIINNESLVNIDGLSNLESINNFGRIRITNNESLVNIDLNSIVIFKLKLIQISNNNSLESITLSNITSSEDGQFEIMETIYINDNPTLINIEGFNTIKKTEGLNIYNNSSLQTINGFSSLTSVNKLEIKENNALTSIPAFDNLTSLYFIKITNNNSLQNINCFNNSTLHNIEIEENNSLEYIDIDGVNAYVFSIKNNNLLTSINLNNITASVDIYDNDSLTTITIANSDAFKWLEIVSNDSLVAIELNNVPHLEFLEINLNQSLVNIDGLSGLTIIDEDDRFVDSLMIGFNQLLENLDGLSSLESVINHRVQIVDNPNLDDFCGLTTLVNNSGIPDDGYASGNLYNPTITDIQDGNCSQ